MPDPIDWSLTIFEGNRRRQHQELLALSFREKIERIGQMAEVIAYLNARRRAKQDAGAPPTRGADEDPPGTLPGA